MRDVSQPEEIVMGMSQQNRSNFSARRSLLPWRRGKSRNFGTEAPKGALKATAVGLLKQNSSSVHRFIRVAFFCPKSNGWSPDISRIAVKKSRQIQPRPETRCTRPGCVCQLQPWGCWGILEPLGQLGPEFWDVYVCLWLVISYDALRCFGWNDLTLLEMASISTCLGLDTACRRHFAMDFWTSTTSFNRYLDSLMTILAYLSRLIQTYPHCAGT